MKKVDQLETQVSIQCTNAPREVDAGIPSAAAVRLKLRLWANSMNSANSARTLPMLRIGESPCVKPTLVQVLDGRSEDQAGIDEGLVAA